MIFISYYTKGNYEKVIQEFLLPSLKKWNLKYDIEGIEDLGSWEKNTHYKATFIKKMLLKHKCQIFFLDADATIEKYPKLVRKLRNYDISYHELDWDLQWRKGSGTKREALSGTLYLNYTPIVLEFLDAWIEENKNNNLWEQKNMENVLKRYKDKLKIYPLPIEYIAIIRHDGKIPPHIKKPVIIHHQVSRKFKNG